jgi:hypothetical protein
MSVADPLIYYIAVGGGLKLVVLTTPHHLQAHPCLASTRVEE